MRLSRLPRSVPGGRRCEAGHVSAGVSTEASIGVTADAGAAVTAAVAIDAAAIGIRPENRSWSASPVIELFD